MLTAFDAIVRLTASPAFVRCSRDLQAVCRRMLRLTLSRSTQFERMNAALYRRAERKTQAAYSASEKELALRLAGEIQAASLKSLTTAPQGESLTERTAPTRGNGNLWHCDATTKANEQTAFGKVEAVKHENKASRFQFNEVYTVSHARVFPVSCEPQEPLVHSPKDVCLTCKAERKEARGKSLTKKETASLKEPHTCYADKGKKNSKASGQATCEPLFCADLKKTRGYEKTLGFSRTIALRYLSKRMVFARKSNAKSVKTDSDGSAVIPASLKARKTSSSKHLTAFYAASDIEDIIQEAFLIFSGVTLGKQGEPLVTLKGNLLTDTCDCARRAYTRFMRAAYKERKRLDILKARLKSREDKARGYANRFYDGEIEALIDAIRVHGATNQKELATALDISAGELSKRLSRLRERKAREERAASLKSLDRIQDVYASHGIPVKASIQTLFRAGA